MVLWAWSALDFRLPSVTLNWRCNSARSSRAEGRQTERLVAERLKNKIKISPSHPLQKCLVSKPYHCPVFDGLQWGKLLQLFGWKSRRQNLVINTPKKRTLVALRADGQIFWVSLSLEVERLWTVQIHTIYKQLQYRTLQYYWSCGNHTVT